MISLQEAYDLVMANAHLLLTERVGLMDILERVLAEDIHSDMDMPPFNKSAMDGFACKQGDLGEEMVIIETIAAGQQPTKTIGKGQCSRIMTGAMVPEGADCVIKVEETVQVEEGIVKFTGGETRPNIAIRGEDIKKGDVVLKKGTLIRPQHIAVLASVGASRPLVAMRPKVAIISTGDEIVEPWEKPGPARIRNSNGYQLYGQVLQHGAIPEYIGIAPDTEEESFTMVEKALFENDIVLLTGGVSMGDFDFIPEVIKHTGATIRFRTINIQPGKPTVFATFNKKNIFGLPGNPVSSYNVFLLLVAPLMKKMMGMHSIKVPGRLPLGVEYHRQKAERMSWIPVSISEDSKLLPIEYHGSAHVHSLVGADAIAGIPEGIKDLKAGEYLDVRFI